MQKVSRVISITAHNPKWKDHFLCEARRISAAFRRSACLDNLVDILHVGSTAVTGLVAKPIIDIIVVVKNADAIDTILTQAGYRYKGEYNIPMRKLYGKKELYEVYLHAYEEGNSEITLNVIFRDYLNTHTDAREAYADLKRAILEKDNAHAKLASTGITTYNLNKNNFIQTILGKAGFRGFCIRSCTQNGEWEAYQVIRNRYLLKIATIGEIIRAINSHDANQKHLVLYAGIKIVAAAQLQLSPPTAFLEFSGYHDKIPAEVGQAFHTYLLTNIEKWIKKMNIRFLITSVYSEEVAAYTVNGYKVIEDQQDSVPMIKCLI